MICRKGDGAARVPVTTVTTSTPAMLSPPLQDSTVEPVCERRQQERRDPGDDIQVGAGPRQCRVGDPLGHRRVEEQLDENPEGLKAYQQAEREITEARSPRLPSGHTRNTSAGTHTKNIRGGAQASSSPDQPRYPVRAIQATPMADAFRAAAAPMVW